MLKNKRKILASMLAMSLIMQFETTIISAYTKNNSTTKTPIFSDVPVKRWSYDIIESFYNCGLIEGYPDGTFRPKEKITRAEVATIIEKLNLDEIKDPIAFTDVLADVWYKDAVDNFVKVGLTNGYPDGTFKPENNLTRNEAFKIIANTYKKVDTDHIKPDFLDQHTVESWAEEYQRQLIYYEKLEGYPDQTIRGGKDITREEFIKLIEHIVDEDFDIQTNINTWQEDSDDSKKIPVKPSKPVAPTDKGGNGDDDDDDDDTVKKSRIPIINQPFENDTEISGKGIPISTITVTLPNGKIINAIVDNNGTWSVSLRTSGYELKVYDKIIAVQKESNKTVSDKTEIAVAKRGLFKVSKGSETMNHIFNNTDNKFLWENGKYPHYDGSLYASDNLVAKEEIEITLYKPSSIKSIGYYFVPLTDINVYNDTNLPNGTINPITSNKIGNDITANGRYIIIAENIDGEKEVKEVVIKNKRDGSITHPFKVSNPEDLKTLKNSDKYYEVINDVNLDGIKWQPIEGFTGHFYGNDFTISNLSITELSNDKLLDIGLFSTITDGSINNINLEVDKIDVYYHIEGQNISANLGGLVASIKEDTIISNVDVTVDGIINFRWKDATYTSVKIGGLAGSVVADTDTNPNSYINIQHCTVNTTENCKLSSLTNQVSRSYSGGAIGFVKGNYIDYTDFDLDNHDETVHNINILDIKVNNEKSIFESDSYTGVAGAIAYNNNSKISGIEVINNGVEFTETSFTGGAIGYVTDSCAENIKVHNIDSKIGFFIDHVDNFTDLSTGGIVGIANDSKLTDFEVINENTILRGKYSGGIIGKINNVNSYNFKVENIDNTLIMGFQAGGGMIGNSTNANFDGATVINTKNSISDELLLNHEGYIGGFIGDAFAHERGTVKNVRVINTENLIDGKIGGGMIGFFRGYKVENSYIENNSNIIKGNIRGGRGGYSGGLCGFSTYNMVNNGNDGIIQNNVVVVNNSSNIYGEIYAGGGIGLLGIFDNLELNVINNGTSIEGEESAGGAIGIANSKAIFSITEGRFVISELIVNNNDLGTVGTTVKGDIAGGAIGGINENKTKLDELKNIRVINDINSEIIGVSCAGGLFGTLNKVKELFFDDTFNVDLNGKVISNAGSVGALIGLITKNEFDTKIYGIKSVNLTYGNDMFTGNNMGKYYGFADSIIIFEPTLLPGDNDLYPVGSRALILPEIPKDAITVDQVELGDEEIPAEVEIIEDVEVYENTEENVNIEVNEITETTKEIP